MSNANYTFKWNQAKLRSLKGSVIDRMINLGQKTANQAQRGAPVKTSALINSIRSTTDKKSHVYVVAGGSFNGYNVPYARRREHENKLHPNKKYYMRNAFSWLRENYANEFKGLTK